MIVSFQGKHKILVIYGLTEEQINKLLETLQNFGIKIEDKKTLICG